jgi:hypothetical protein
VGYKPEIVHQNILEVNIRICNQNNMDSIAKTVFTSKLNSVTDSVSKGFNFGDEKEEKDDDQQLTSKEVRKLEEQDRAERAKRDEQHAKRNEQRQKKREAIRAKYGLSNETESGERRPSQGKADDSKNTEEKSCAVM